MRLWEDDVMRGRLPSKNSEYYLPVHAFRVSLEYALNYDTWKAEIRSLRNQSKAIRYDKDKVQSNSDYNPTEAAALAINELQHKVDKIEKSIEEVSPDGLADYIKLAVCYGFTYTQLTTGRHHMPLNKNDFGKIKHHFYYNLYDKI